MLIAAQVKIISKTNGSLCGCSHQVGGGAVLICSPEQLKSKVFMCFLGGCVCVFVFLEKHTKQQTNRKIFLQ